MREYIFHGKRVDNGEWVEGYLIKKTDPLLDIPYYFILRQEYDTSCIDGRPTILESEVRWYKVEPESVGQHTGMTEFVVTDRTFNKPLFEGDIVEVWSRRRPPIESICLYRDKTTSQYDIEVKARAVIRFKHGEWALDYENNYNKALCELRGNEQCERTVNASHRLYSFGFHRSNEEWHREHNARCKWDDIVKIGTMFENADLLEE